MLAPGSGRAYSLGRIAAVFKADGAETESKYSVSEWWMEPHTPGLGVHAHPGDEAFFVLEGTMSFLLNGTWTDAPARSFVLVPGGVEHDFENRGSVRAGMLYFTSPGAFEPFMPGIVESLTVIR